jgi:hypothetical protein
VRYVVVTKAAADYSARGEVALLRSGRSVLRPVFGGQGLEILRVPSAQPIITGAPGARILGLARDWIDVRVRRPGRYRIAVRHSPYWSASSGCLSRSPDGMLELTARRAGAVELTFAPSAARLFNVATGRQSTDCAPRS